MIETQRRLKHPLGAIFQRLGMRPPTTNLVGPAEVLRGTRQAQWVVPRLIYLEKLLFR